MGDCDPGITEESKHQWSEWGEYQDLLYREKIKKKQERVAKEKKMEDLLIEIYEYSKTAEDATDFILWVQDRLSFLDKVPTPLPLDTLSDE